MYQQKVLPFLAAILLAISILSFPKISFAQSDKEKLDLIKSLFSTPDEIKKQRPVDYVRHELELKDTVIIKSCINLYKTSMKKHGIRDSVGDRLFNFRMLSKHSPITHEEDFFGDSLFEWMEKMVKHKNKDVVVKIKIVFATYSKTFLDTIINDRTRTSDEELKRIFDKKGRTTAILVAYAYKPKAKTGNFKSEEDPLDGFLGGYDLGEIHPPY